MKQAKSTSNMAMELTTFIDGKAQTSRTLAIPPGLTHAEVEAWVKPWMGAFEQMTGVMVYS